MLQVLVTAYNCPHYLKTCLSSLLNQRVQKWRCWVTDDVSTDDTGRRADAFAIADSRITVIHNTKTYQQVGNYDQVIARSEIAPDDICVTLDGDDWFPDPDVLGRVLAVYSDPQVWITWGSYRNHDGRMGCSAPVADVTRLRNADWHTSHLRTFKAFLWRALRHEDLMGPAGDWYVMAACDMGFMFPLLEMATNEHARFLPDINYIYNAANPLNEHKLRNAHLLACDKFNRSRPSYSPLVRS